VQAHGERSADDALASDDRHLHAAAIAGQNHQRREAFVQEIRVFDFFSRFMKNFMVRQFDMLKMRGDQIEFAARNRLQNLIVSCRNSRIFHRRRSDWDSWLTTNVQAPQTCSSYKPAQSRFFEETGCA